METKYRIRYIDALRGFTMFLVVMLHVISNSIKFMPVSIQLLQFFRMPTFFFISGFIAYKPLEVWTTSHYGRQMRKKAFVQIIPALIFTVFYQAWMKPEPLLQYFTHIGDYILYYWFTFALFAMFVVYYALSWIAHRFNNEKIMVVGMLIVAIATAAFHVCHRFPNPSWQRNLHVEDLIWTVQFFTMGVLARKYNEKFFSIIKNQWFNGVVIVLFFLCALIYLNQWRSVPGFYFIHYCLGCWLGLVILFTLFKRKEEYFNSNSRLARVMVFIGRRTLDIYLIHLFFLPPMQWLRPYIEGGDKALLQWVVGGVLAAVVIALCMIVSEIIRSSDLLAHWLLGVSKKRKEEKNG